MKNAIYLVLLALMVLSLLYSCKLDAIETTIWLSWISPDPVVGELDRIVITASPNIITDDNWIESSTLAIQSNPAPYGERDSISITADADNAFYVVAVAYNTKYLQARSGVSNNVYIGGPKAISNLEAR